MAISEESRHQLHNKLDEVLGPAEAATLMSHLPPIGWADVATKHDLIELERRLDLRFDQVNARFEASDRSLDGMDARMQAGFAEIHRRFDETFREFRALLVSVMSVMAVLFAAMAGAIIAAIKI